MINTHDLQDWLLSSKGLFHEVEALRRWSAFRSFSDGVLEPADSGEEPYKPNWPRMLLASSLLAESERPAQQEVALMVAQAAMVFGDTGVVQDAGAIVLTQLSNNRSVLLAENRELIAPNVQGRIGISSSILATRRALESSIVLNQNSIIEGNEFQVDLWRKLKGARWTSATAPTSTGKTYLILNWLLNEVERRNCRLAVFLAPTRALVSELEKELLDLKSRFNVPRLRVASLPIKGLGDLESPTILVFTQERLHLFLNAFGNPPPFDIAVVDEVQKLGDGLRGVILQDAIERLSRTSERCRFVFLSPHAENPEIVLEDAPLDADTAFVPSGPPTVTQNLMIARQRKYKPLEWSLSIVTEEADTVFGWFRLHDRPAGRTSLKRLSYVALALGRRSSGTLVYANGAADAEKIAQQIYDGLAPDHKNQSITIDDELKDLSDFCRISIHSRFQLVHLVKRGVAFHYGNMPSILRGEIERLFRAGKIRFLVCTSTLMEGVNLACRTIIVKGPRKGRGQPMFPQDFWNLAGRAGRWGADFHGNIVCVDADDEKQWPYGVPRKSAYPIQRETDQVLKRGQTVIDYVVGRTAAGVGYVDETIEPVAAYLMAWHARTGSVTGSPSVVRMEQDLVSSLDEAIGIALDNVEIPDTIITAHPGITAIALQALLNAFRAHEGELELLLPPAPESADAVVGIKDVFTRIDEWLYPAFGSDRAQWAFAFTTVDWMRGKRLGEMIGGALRRERENGRYASDDDLPYARIIRDTMRQVEEIARFKAPKYLSAYLDVLRFHFSQQGADDQFPEELSFDLYLEFGVSTQTLLALIGLGLSRNSAIEMNEFLARGDLSEEEVLSTLLAREWEALDLPNVVKREIRQMLLRREFPLATN